MFGRGKGSTVGRSRVSSVSPSRRSRDMAGNEAARRLQHAQFEAPIAEGNEEGKGRIGGVGRGDPLAGEYHFLCPPITKRKEE